LRGALIGRGAACFSDVLKEYLARHMTR